MTLLDRLLAHFQDDPQHTASIAAVWDLHDIHIDASLTDDMATAKLAHLLMLPTPEELEWTAEDYDALNY